MAEKYISQYTGLKIDEAIGLALLLNSLRGGANGLATLDANKKLAQMPDASDVGAVPTERTVNGKPLSADITLNAPDVGALPSTEKGQPNGIATLDAEGNLVQSHAAGFKLSVAQGGTGAGDPVNARSNLGMGNLLWSGSWSSGNISVPEIPNYSVLQIIFTRSSITYTMVASIKGIRLRGICGDVNVDGGQTSIAIACTISGTTLTNLTFSGFFLFPSGTISQMSGDFTITEIYGVC